MAKETHESEPTGSSLDQDRSTPSAPSSPKLVAIEPDRDNRRRLVEILNAQNEFALVGHGESLSDALSSSHSLKPDIVIVDVDHKSIASPQAWAILRTTIPDSTRIIGLSNGQNAPALQLSLVAGLASLLPLRATEKVLMRALRMVSSGRVEFHPSLIASAKRALLTGDQPPILSIGGLLIGLDARSVSRWGDEVHLSPLEFSVLVELAKNSGDPVSMDRLLEIGWQSDMTSGGTRDQVKSCIKRLQRKLEPEPGRPRYIRWNGEGYSLVDPYG